MKVLFDTNVLLDIVLSREPFRSASVRAAEHALDGDLTGFISVQSLKDVFYFVSKVRNEEEAFDKVEKLSVLFRPIGISPEDSLAALMSDFTDFEDGLINASAVRNGMDAILTRDCNGFSESALLIIHPDDLDAYLESGTASGSVTLG